MTGESARGALSVRVARDPGQDCVARLVRGRRGPIRVTADVGRGEYPPSARAELAAVDAALDRVRTRARETGERVEEAPDTTALRALRALVAEDRGVARPPVVLLSQLVDGDEESFDLALADALEAHRASYRVAYRADTPDASLDLDVLGPACHARRRTLRPRWPRAGPPRGWDVRVGSPYLPPHLLSAAEPFCSGRDAAWPGAPRARAWQHGRPMRSVRSRGARG
ncbi:immunity 49 family protein [Streptomyces sp. WAC06614]|uniref:immunity 49 family protein n=1 Tax=Streptomyces sp. WAC06614 TaxID=2487416 RepID=UPI000F792E2B|nr:immunity 49 family protein [Streptomyces sp. WAC06614]RSS58352.1 hypothetical protein EF918_33200 [Streptomyces sp. WAC06614]